MDVWGLLRCFFYAFSVEVFRFFCNYCRVVPAALSVECFSLKPRRDHRWSINVRIQYNYIYDMNTWKYSSNIGQDFVNYLIQELTRMNFCSRYKWGFDASADCILLEINLSVCSATCSEVLYFSQRPHEHWHGTQYIAGQQQRERCARFRDKTIISVCQKKKKKSLLLRYRRVIA